MINTYYMGDQYGWKSPGSCCFKVYELGGIGGERKDEIWYFVINVVLGYISIKKGT